MPSIWLIPLVIGMVCFYQFQTLCSRVKDIHRLLNSRR